VGLIGKKSQIAMEFMLMISLAIVVLIMMMGVLFFLFNNYSEEKNINKLTDLGYSLQSEFILAAEVETGYERSITLMPDIGGANYSIRISNKEIMIKYRNTDFLFMIPQVSGTITTKGTFTIKKTDADTITVS
jgi:uncharacterized protein (UPF0333 family)